MPRTSYPAARGDQSPGATPGRDKGSSSGDLQPLLDKEDVAEVLAIGLRTFERLVAAGKFPAPDLKIGRMPRWRPETVERWLGGGGK